MGCSTCKSECGREDGCGSRKAAQKEILDALVARLYPSRTFGAPDDEAGFRAGPSIDEVRRLSQQLAVALRARVFVRPGDDDDPCTFVYALCLGREPSLLEVREGDDAALLELVRELAPPQRLSERHLRLSLSQLGRLVAIQEVALELDLGCGLAPEGMAVIREIPKPGVFDPKLLKRFQKAVDLVQALGYEHLDMGLLDVPAEGFGLVSGDYERRYGQAPMLFNFFFHAQPVLTASAAYLPLPAA